MRYIFIYLCIMESRITHCCCCWIMIDECSLLFQICFCNVAKMDGSLINLLLLFRQDPRFMVNSYTRYKHSLLLRALKLAILILGLQNSYLSNVYFSIVYVKLCMIKYAKSLLMLTLALLINHGHRIKKKNSFDFAPKIQFFVFCF